MRSLYCYLIFFALCIACKNKKSFVPISEMDAEQMQAVLDNREDSLHPGAGAKEIRKKWMELQKICFVNDVFKNPNYLGLTNTYGIGTLIDPDGGYIYKDLAKIIPASDYQRFFNINTPFASICAEAKNKKIEFDVLLNGVINKVTDAELSAKLKKSKDARVIAGSWRQLNATLGDVLDYIDSSKAAGMISYREYFGRKNIFLVAAVLEVSNFSANLHFDSDLEAGITAKFKNDSSKLTINEVGGSITLKKNGTKDILVECNAAFVPLVVLYKRQ